MENIRILIVDDEKKIREMVIEYIKPEGYEVFEAGNGIEALRIINENNFSVIILDVMMPGTDGWAVLAEIRREKCFTPVIMLTARGEEHDKLFGFELGADDYVVKPFSPKELLARIRVAIRRGATGKKESENLGKIKIEGLLIDYESRRVFVNDIEISLTPKEYEILSYFAKRPGKVISREQLLNEIWGYEYFGDYRTVDTHIKMLRESIKEYRKFIVTVWGIGYRFQVGGKI